MKKMCYHSTDKYVLKKNILTSVQNNLETGHLSFRDLLGPTSQNVTVQVNKALHSHSAAEVSHKS